ncbi:MAG: hypothetical protein AB7P42_01360 [Gammaproteobacteria bacterium]
MSVALARQRRSRLLADSLFYVQAACALAMGLSQLRRMLDSVEGVSISWMLFWVAFLAVNLGLAVRAHRSYASRLSRQTIIIYCLWTALCGANLLFLLLAPDARWNLVDSVTTGLTLGGVTLATLIGRARGLRLGDPMLHAAYAVFCKAVPQLTLAWNILREGGAGISIVAFTAGHITICLRLWQVVMSIREAGLDRNRLGLAIGEAANEASWVVATVVWVLV